VTIKVKKMINPVDLKIQKSHSSTKCPDCYAGLDIPCDVVAGEILSCPVCGLELEVKKVVGGEGLNLQELIIEGEDWGE
jgi:alpha-aminoadipate carrier protein LysW